MASFKNLTFGLSTFLLAPSVPVFAAAEMLYSTVNGDAVDTVSYLTRVAPLYHSYL